MATLCGTNVFLVGHQSSNERIMIDAGDVSKKNRKFLENITKYFDDLNRPDVYISKILITHAHHDHIGGLYDVLNLLKERGQKFKPKIFKHINHNRFENEIFKIYPNLKNGLDCPKE